MKTQGTSRLARSDVMRPNHCAQKSNASEHTILAITNPQIMLHTRGRFFHDHHRAGLYPEHDEDAEQDGHPRAPGHTKEERRDQAARFLGVRGGIRRDHALDGSLAERSGVFDVCTACP